MLIFNLHLNTSATNNIFVFSTAFNLFDMPNEFIKIYELTEYFVMVNVALNNHHKFLE